MIELRNIPFAQQWQMIQLIGKTLKNFEGAAFDSRGNGQMIAEYAVQEWSGYVYQVMLTRKWYAENFPFLKSAFEDKTTTVPADDFIRNDFSTVKMVQGVPLISERTGRNVNKRHGDACIESPPVYWTVLCVNFGWCFPTEVFRYPLILVAMKK